MADNDIESRERGMIDLLAEISNSLRKSKEQKLRSQNTEEIKKEILERVETTEFKDFLKARFEKQPDKLDKIKKTVLYID